MIANRAASISAEVETAGAGVAVDHARALGAALRHVATEYDAMSARACAFFDDRLAFGRAFAEVVRRVDALQ